MTDTKTRTLDRIQLNKHKLNFQSYPKPNEAVCLLVRQKFSLLTANDKCLHDIKTL